MTSSPDIEAPFRLDGKNAVVTGAAAGIGRAVAVTLAKAGARVVAADLNADGVQATVKLVGGNAVAATCDVANEASVVALFETAARTVGAVDILVNVAGIYPKTPFLETSADKWDKIQAVNLRGTFLCMREAVKRMKASGNGGSIVNISSVGSMLAVIFDAADYGASKAGVNNLTKTAALEFAADRIRVNAILPGGVATEQAAQSVVDRPAQGPITQPGRVPLGRIGQPEDIANAVLFLASPAADYITGQLLAVDGGFLVS